MGSQEVSKGSKIIIIKKKVCVEKKFSPKDKERERSAQLPDRVGVYSTFTCDQSRRCKAMTHIFCVTLEGWTFFSLAAIGSLPCTTTSSPFVIGAKPIFARYTTFPCCEYCCMCQISQDHHWGKNSA